MIMLSGTHGKYFWIEWSSPTAFLYDFVSAFPQIVINKYLAVTSCDSGPLRPSEQERQEGWFAEYDIAYSPKIDNISAIPNDQFDEWYIFPSLTLLPTMEVFINYGVFSLSNPKLLFPEWSPQLIAARCEEQERFWQQLNLITPESYVAEGDRLLFVTRDPSLFAQVAGWPMTELTGE
jgi:hypothetical protein